MARWVDSFFYREFGAFVTAFNLGNLFLLPMYFSALSYQFDLWWVPLYEFMLAIVLMAVSVAVIIHAHATRSRYEEKLKEDRLRQELRPMFARKKLRIFTPRIIADDNVSREA